MNKFNNLEEMVKFLELYSHLSLNRKEIENPNKPITGKEIETVIKIKIRVPDQMASQVNSTKSSKMN